MSDPMNIVVVGAGGTGGWLIQGLARVLNNHRPDSFLVIVDGDTYEAKNRDRQAFSKVGNKAEVMVGDISGNFPNIYMVPDTRWVATGAEEGSETHVSPESLLNEGDIVFAVVDNNATRKLIFDAAKTYDNIDVFTGGNDEALYGTTWHYQRRDGTEITDHPGDWHDEFINPPDRNPADLDCAERAALDGGSQTVAANMAVASVLLARFTHLFLSKKDEELEDKATEVMFDLALGLAAPTDYRNPDILTTGE